MTVERVLPEQERRQRAFVELRDPVVDVRGVQHRRALAGPRLRRAPAKAVTTSNLGLLSSPLFRGEPGDNAALSSSFSPYWTFAEHCQSLTQIAEDGSTSEKSEAAMGGNTKEGNCPADCRYVHREGVTAMPWWGWLAFAIMMAALVAAAAIAAMTYSQARIEERMRRARARYETGEPSASTS
jgi:hypothetical protein